MLAATFALTLELAGLPGNTAATAADRPSTALISSAPHAEPDFFRADARLLVHTMPSIAGTPTQATTLLFVPRGTPPAGGWPIVAWAHGTTTPGQKTCAPSLSPDFDGGLTRDGFKSDYAFEIGKLVNAGYAVVAPDLEGLGPVATERHPYFGEASFARSLIAGVRAAREAEPTLSSRYAVVGHSEGGHGALDVDKHATEAPELTLVGIVALAPYTSIAATAALSAERARAEPDPATAQSFRVTQQFQVMLMSAGLLAESPDFDPGTVMGDNLKRILPQFRASCSVPSIAVIQGAMATGGAPYAFSEPLGGATAGTVVESRHVRYRPGDLVVGPGGWQRYSAYNADEARKLPTDMEHPSQALGVLGMTGLTAWHGLLAIGKPKTGETLVVGAASGAVGSIVGQMAKLKGCRIVGVAGGPDKCRYVVETLGFDACMDHRDADLSAKLKAAVPEGIDIYFENVGGAVFDAAWPLLNLHARVPVCGLVAGYNGADTGSGHDRLPELAFTLIAKRITMKGFMSGDHAAQFDAFTAEMSAWLAAGKITAREDITEGLDRAPAAFIGMLEGANFGKAIVRV